MNIVNMMKAIEIMKQATNLDMTAFQDWNGVMEDDFGYVTTVQELHTCGNTACFAGYVAISHEFHADGGSVCSETGAPEISATESGLDGEHAMAYWLDIPVNVSMCLIYGTDDVHGNDSSSYYSKNLREVTPEDVIAKLEWLLANDPGGYDGEQ